MKVCNLLLNINETIINDYLNDNEIDDLIFKKTILYEQIADDSLQSTLRVAKIGRSIDSMVDLIKSFKFKPITFN